MSALESDWSLNESVYLLEHKPETNTSGRIWRYSAVLKLVEEIVNIYIIVSLVVLGLDTQAYYLFLITMLSFLVTALFLVISLLESLIEMNASYYWIEFSYGLSSGISLAITSTLVLASMPKGYILTSMVGYLNTGIYFLDAINKYYLAINPRRKLFWNRPVEILYGDD